MSCHLGVVNIASGMWALALALDEKVKSAGSKTQKWIVGSHGFVAYPAADGQSSGCGHCVASSANIAESWQPGCVGHKPLRRHETRNCDMQSRRPSIQIERKISSSRTFTVAADAEKLLHVNTSPQKPLLSTSAA